MSRPASCPKTVPPETPFSRSKLPLGARSSPATAAGPASVNSLRVGVGQVSAWSAKSQIQPPCNTSWARITSQYFLKLPLEFPIAWEYSIRTKGRVSAVSLARCSTWAAWCTSPSGCH